MKKMVSVLVVLSLTTNGMASPIVVEDPPEEKNAIALEAYDSQSAGVSSYKPQKKEEIEPWVKQLAGWILTIGGVVLAIDGFRQIDISKPALDISNYSWSKTKIISWWVDSYGTVRNTGNVALKNVRIFRTYYSATGAMIANDYCYLDVNWLDPLPVSSQDSWSYFNGGWYTEPTSMSVRAEYEYEKIYKTKSVGEGVAGVVCCLVGVWILYDASLQSRNMPISLKPRLNPEPGLLVAYEF